MVPVDVALPSPSYCSGQTQGCSSPPGRPLPGPEELDTELERIPTTGLNEVDQTKSRTRAVARRVWLIIHRLQGFEARYALKTVITTALITTPAWDPSSMNWWNEHDAWLGVAMAWIMMHSRFVAIACLFCLSHMEYL